MDTSLLARQLLQDTMTFHAQLIEQARAVGKLRTILEFIVECISFAEVYLPAGTVNSWAEGSALFSEMSTRTQSIYGSPTPTTSVSWESTLITSGSAATGIFGVLTDNFIYLEDNESRSQYVQLAGKYVSLISGPEEQGRVYSLLGPLNNTAQGKFIHSLESLQALPMDEDPQGPLLEMRSAIDLALDALLKLTPLTRRERGDLKSVNELPTIARYLAKDDLAKIDIVLASNRLEKLKSQLSASKQESIPRIQAEAMMSQAVAILNLIARTVRLPENQSAG